MSREKAVSADLGLGPGRPSGEPPANATERGFGLTALIRLLEGEQGRADYGELVLRLREQLVLASALIDIDLWADVESAAAFDPRWDV